MNAQASFPAINSEGTGHHIEALCRQASLTVPDLQNYFGLEHPQAVDH